MSDEAGDAHQRWLAARDALLVRERELTRHIEELLRRQRELLVMVEQRNTRKLPGQPPDQWGAGRSGQRKRRR